MNRTNSYNTYSGISAMHTQSGVALFVGLVMLVIITLIGISGVRSVVMEKNMTSNNQYQMLVFQAAETAIEGTFADGAAFIAALNTPTGSPWPTRNYSATHAANYFAVASNAEISVGLPTVPIGYTIGDFVTYPFTIIGTGAITTINAADRHVQTASKLAPFPR